MEDITAESVCHTLYYLSSGKCVNLEVKFEWVATAKVM